MYPFKSDIVLGEGIYNDNEYAGIQRLDAIRQSSGIDPAIKELLNSQAVYAFGNDAQFGSKNFPILMQTQGMGRTCCNIL